MGDTEEQKAYVLFLENATYRSLQYLAKSLSLPSNYKKVYLIELIYAKKYCTEEIVKTIIQRVKIERSSTAKNRKRNRRKRFTMPPRTKSPAISATPKRRSVYVPFRSDLKTAKRNTTRHSLLDAIKEKTLPRTSDRVLRSFNLRQKDNSNYNTCLVNSSECNIVQNALNTKAIVKIDIPTENYEYYMNTECVVRKHSPAILNSTCNETRKPLILKQGDVVVQGNITAARRKRTISGIYDDTQSKLNAFIQKCNTNYMQKITSCNTEVNIQDLINSIDDDIENQDMPSPRTAENEPTISLSILNSQENYTEPATSYSYHIDRMKYQMMYDRSSQYTDNPVLPKINEVFLNMNCMKNIVQPLYDQVSSEDELSRNYPLFADNCNTELLESFYNFKSQMLTNVPLLPIATTDNTKSTYSTSTVTSAREHHSASHGNDFYDYNPFEQDNGYMNDPRLYEYYQQERNSVLDRSSSSMLIPATVLENLEDAVELISQDNTISADPVPRMGGITVYNRHTGEPYSWMGNIQPNSDDSSGLRVSITQLD